MSAEAQVEQMSVFMKHMVDLKHLTGHDKNK